MDERHYKIWIVNYFSELFRALKAKYTFIYGDFIQPGKTILNSLNYSLRLARLYFIVSKKCFEVLRFLLNYHLFIKEVVQDEVIHTADSKIETFNQLLAKKNQLHIHQEEFKIRSEKVSNQWMNATVLRWGCHQDVFCTLTMEWFCFSQIANEALMFVDVFICL